MRHRERRLERASAGSAAYADDMRIVHGLIVRNAHQSQATARARLPKVHATARTGVIGRTYML